VRTFILAIAKRILPKRFIDWYRRRRALRRYLKALAFEIYDRGIRLEIDDLEGRIAARRDGFYDRLVKDVLERTELVLQELDRKVEGLAARHGSELRHLQSEITELRAAAHELQTTLPPGTAEPRMAEGSPASAER
jgi:hypothetical protein